MPNDPKDARRQEIIAAALKAFTEKGYDKTSMDDIVRVSGLSKGTLYWYFDNKQALFAAVAKMVFDQFVIGADAVLGNLKDLPPSEKLQQVMLMSGMAAMQDRQFVHFYMDIFVQAWQQDVVRQVSKEAYSKYIDLFAAILQEGIDKGDFRAMDVNAMARAITGSLDGMMAQLLFGPDGDLEAPIQALIETLVRGLVKGN
ncbi:MAG: TetR/AcrR family transcriptional regulator [Chloroflexota bacterium]